MAVPARFQASLALEEVAPAREKEVDDGVGNGTREEAPDRGPGRASRSPHRRVNVPAPPGLRASCRKKVKKAARVLIIRHAPMTNPASTFAAGPVGIVKTQYFELPEPVRLDCGRDLYPVRVA